MARLSLWQDGKHSNDYKFFDRRISEMFTLGGTGILLHKYLGVQANGLQLTTSAAQTTTSNQLSFADTSRVNLKDSVTGTGIPPSTTVVAKTSNTVTLSNNTVSTVAAGLQIGFSADATQPSYVNQSEKNIQDLLWTENRDRTYDTSVYKMRGVYQRQDQDFDLTQFGIFLQTGTVFMTFHLRDMVDLLGRKIMAGDVLELQHLKDYDALDQDVPAALARYYSVSDASLASEGFSPSWWPHLWRVKINPLVDGQEYKQIINSLIPGTTTPVGQVISTLDRNLSINDAVITQSLQNVPVSGYDTSTLFNLPLTEQNTLYDQIGTVGNTSPANPLPAYLPKSGLAPNGVQMAAGITFPINPALGDFFLRTDYMPNRIFRFDGTRWLKYEDILGTLLIQGPNNNTLIGSFVNDTSTYATVGNVVTPTRQSLSNALTPKADNIP